MKRFKTLFLLIAITMLSSKIWAEDQVLILSGLPTGTMDKITAEFIYDISTLKKRKVNILESSGDWEFDSKKVHIKPISKKTIKTTIKSIGKKIGKKDTLTLYISGRGGAPSLKRPLSAKISLNSSWYSPFTSELSYSELEEFLKKYIPKEVSIHLVGASSFSGGLHEISFRNPNICSATNVDFRSPTGISSATKGDPFSIGFWKELKKKEYDFNEDGKVSFLEAFFAGMDHDTANSGRNLISSLSFINKITNSGEYDPHNNGSKIMGFLRGSTATSNYISFKIDELQCHVDIKIKGSEKELSHFMEDINKQISLLMIRQGSPNELRQILEKIKERWKKKYHSFESELSPNLKKLSILKKKWNDLNSKGKRKNAQIYMEEFINLERQTKLKLSSLTKYQHVIDWVKKLEHFYKKATPEEIKILDHLIQCELGPL